MPSSLTAKLQFIRVKEKWKGEKKRLGKEGSSK
jgi:hypothetical protein